MPMPDPLMTTADFVNLIIASVIWWLWFVERQKFLLAWASGWSLIFLCCSLLTFVYPGYPSLFLSSVALSFRLAGFFMLSSGLVMFLGKTRILYVKWGVLIFLISSVAGIIPGDQVLHERVVQTVIAGIILFMGVNFFISRKFVLYERIFIGSVLVGWAGYNFLAPFIRHRNGLTFWFSSVGILFSLLVPITILLQYLRLMRMNIAESRQRILENGNALRLVLTSMPALLVAMDEQGLFIEWNRECERVLGYRSDEIIGNPAALESLYPNDLDRQRLYKLLSSGGGDFRDLEVLMTARDGSLKAVSWSNVAASNRIPEWKYWLVGYDVTPMRAASREVLAARDQLLQIMETVSSAIAQFDPGGNLVYGNSAFCSLFGYDAAEISGKKFRHFFSDDPESVAENFSAIVSGEPVADRFSGKGLTRDGINFDIVVKWDYLRDPSGKLSGIVAVIWIPGNDRDLIRSVDTSEGRYRQLFNNMTTGVAVYRAVDNGDDFIFVDVNEAGQRLSSIRRSLVVGKRISEVFPAVREMGLLDLMTVVWRTGQEGFLPLREYSDNRITQWVENHVFRLPDGNIVCMYDDTTVMRQAQEALRESEENLRTTLDSIGDAVIVTNFQGKVVRMNRVAERLTGWSGSEAAGNDFDAVCVTKDVVSGMTFSSLFGIIIGNEGETIESEKILVAKSGREITINDSGSVIKKDDGTVIGIVYVFRDVTSRVMMEQQLRQSQKMDSIGQLAGGIAHDFNNMLAGIMGGAEILNIRLPGDSPLRDYINLIMKASQKASELTQKLLAFSRKAKIESTAIDLHQVIGDASHLLERSIDRRIELVLRLDASMSVVTGDPTQLENAILNLGVNARDAMPGGGKLTIATQNIELDAEFCALIGPDMKPGAYIEVSVSDTGVGISPEIMPKIFEPFFTTKAVGAGTGLGLAAVYGTLREHGGGIRVDSRPGEGSVFSSYLPLAVIQEVPAFVDSSDSHHGRGSVLIVDDEEVVRMFLRELLKGMSYTVIEAADGREAVDMVSGNREISLMIIDLVMPRMSGRDAFREIRSKAPDLPVIFSSGFSREGSISDLISSGKVWFLQKPYRRMDLVRLLNEIFHDGRAGDDRS